MGSKKFTSEYFIERSRLIHGDNYDYSKVIYKTSKIKVIINCPKHGTFKQEPNSHLSGYGCPVCGSMRKSFSNQDFIKKAKLVHGEEYDYSELIYKNKRSKVKIICKKHGMFEMLANDHIQGRGCKICVKEKRNSKTIEEFIKASNLTHNNKYDYSKVTYDSSKDKYNYRVKIICKDHGEFFQTMKTHKNGGICPNCLTSSIEKKLIEKSKKKHSNKYDYSKVKYKKSYEKVEIICKKHGSFFQIFDDHSRGRGCPKCSGNYKSSTEEFISIARSVHKNKYDYSKLEYVNRNTKVRIICKIHGDFFQNPYRHLQGAQCAKCVKKFKYTKEMFIDEAKKIHGEKYDYSRVIYKTNKIKVIINCKKHGIFEQKPNDHLAGHGCPNCGTGVYDTQTFIKIAKEIHNNRYFYSKSNYKGSKKQIEIECPDHGFFKIRAGDHLRSGERGCPFCGLEIRALGDTVKTLRKKKYNIKGVIYVIKCFALEENFFKIGITYKSVKIRYRSKNSLPYKFSILMEHKMNIVDAFLLEQEVLKSLKSKKLNYTPLIDFGGKTECFKVNPIEVNKKLRKIYQN